jgi:predicted lysophospholipase L1 biosynthesis ABC-type transport system permease subunit
MRRLGLSIGDRVEMRAPDTPLGAVPARVVGRAVVNNTYGLEPGVGGVIDGEWAKRLATKVGFDPIPQQVAVRVADGADRATVLRELRRTFPESYSPPVPSTSLRNLGRLRGLPWTLVVMLFVLAVGVTLHALVTGIRRRRPELAVLRSLGFTRRDTRSSLLWQTLALALVAGVVGIPLGIIVGRLGWRAITSSNGLSGGAVVPVGPALVVAGLALLLPLLLVVVPAVRESRRAVTDVLRVE